MLFGENPKVCSPRCGSIFAEESDLPVLDLDPRVWCADYHPKDIGLLLFSLLKCFQKSILKLRGSLLQDRSDKKKEKAKEQKEKEEGKEDKGKEKGKEEKSEPTEEERKEQERREQEQLLIHGQ